MKPQAPAFHDESYALYLDAEEVEQLSEDDLWFLPSPMEEEPDYLPPGPGAEPREAEVLDDWRKAEAGHAARLARVASRVGALDDRLMRGPEGWRHRLALIEAADLSWFVGDRIGPDRLALWISMRLPGLQEDAAALARAGWAVRRLTGGPGPEADLSAFLDRRDPENMADEAEPFADRAGGWLDLMAQAADMHPITRACMGFHLWSLAGLGQQDDQMEAAVTASRIAASEGKGGIFVPLAVRGAGGLRAGGPPDERLARWLEGIETASLTVMRHLDDIEAWSKRTETVMAVLSGRTPPALRSALTEWPLISAPMAEALTGASRAAVQRNLAWMEARGLIREVPMICSSVNLLRFMSVSFTGERTKLKVRTFQGSRSDTTTRNGHTARSATRSRSCWRNQGASPARHPERSRKTLPSGGPRLGVGSNQQLAPAAAGLKTSGR